MLSWDLGRVFSAAVLSRCLVLALALASDWAVDDYDTSARWDVPNTGPSCEMSDGDDKIVQKDPLARAFCRVVENGLAWDSLHFLRIAQCGYETEKSYAFFPLLPGVMRGLQATVLHWALPALYPRCTLALAGFLVSNTAFVFAALVLYWLGCITLRDGDMARRAAYLFCFNPASVFYSAVYSESLFAFLTFSGALSLALGRPYRAAVAFFASSTARSNGVANCALLAWDTARRVAALPRRRTGRLPLFRAALELLLGAARCAFAAAPFFGFQLWGWYRFCNGGPYGGVGRPWCTRRPASIYAFVQEHYWDIGFLRYYRKEQLPNFALAAPMLAVTAAGVAAYWRADPHRVATLGLATQRMYTKPRELTALEQAAPMCAADQRKRMHAGELVPFGFPVGGASSPKASASLPPLSPASPTTSASEEGSALRRRRASSDSAARAEAEAEAEADAPPAPAPPTSPPFEMDADAPLPAVVLTSTPQPRPRDGDGGGAPEWGFLATPVFPFVAVWAALALPAALVMHVQVATRFLSACPALYWYGAQLSGTRPALGRLLWAWSLLYAAVGTVLFVNFYPWT